MDSIAASSKLSSHRCLVRLDSVIGERGRSSFSMVDCLKAVVTRAILTVKTEVVTVRLALVWFPDPSVMRMRGRGKKGLGNNYTPARALEFDLNVPLSGCG